MLVRLVTRAGLRRRPAARAPVGLVSSDGQAGSRCETWRPAVAVVPVAVPHPGQQVYDTVTLKLPTLSPNRSSLTANWTAPVPDSVVGPLPTCTQGPDPTRPTSPQAGAPGSRNPPNELTVVSHDGLPPGPKQGPPPPNGQTAPVAVTVTDSPFSRTTPPVTPVRPGLPRCSSPRPSSARPRSPRPWPSAQRPRPRAPSARSSSWFSPS
jgi:hypothetical protein